MICSICGKENMDMSIKDGKFKCRPVCKAIVDFKPGKYQHYKGGIYSAIALVTHHDTRAKMVLYISLGTGEMNVRELHPASGVDAWEDDIITSTGTKKRFTLVED